MTSNNPPFWRPQKLWSDLRSDQPKTHKKVKQFEEQKIFCGPQEGRGVRYGLSIEHSRVSNLFMFFLGGIWYDAPHKAILGVSRAFFAGGSSRKTRQPLWHTTIGSPSFTRKDSDSAHSPLSAGCPLPNMHPGMIYGPGAQPFFPLFYFFQL